MGKKWPKMKRSENKISQLMTKISGFTATAEAATTTTAPNDNNNFRCMKKRLQLARKFQKKRPPCNRLQNAGKTRAKRVQNARVTNDTNSFVWQVKVSQKRRTSVGKNNKKLKL